MKLSVRENKIDHEEILNQFKTIFRRLKQLTINNAKHSSTDLLILFHEVNQLDLLLILKSVQLHTLNHTLCDTQSNKEKLATHLITRLLLQDAREIVNTRFQTLWVYHHAD